jgi:hypothetical protein
MILQRHAPAPTEYLPDPDPETSDKLDAASAAADAAHRLERFERSKDPSVLWPGLTEAARVAAAREIERASTTRTRSRSPDTPRGWARWWADGRWTDS